MAKSKKRLRDRLDADIYEQLRRLVKEKMSIERAMQEIKDGEISNYELEDEYLEKWTMNAYAIQILIGYPANQDYHRDYLIPGCTSCPKIDNEERYGTGLRYRNSGCPYHRFEKYVK